jgi:hypothetical protein
MHSGPKSDCRCIKCENIGLRVLGTSKLDYIKISYLFIGWFCLIADFDFLALLEKFSATFLKHFRHWQDSLYE